MCDALVSVYEHADTQPCVVCVSAVMSEQAVVHVSSSSRQGLGHRTALHRAATVGNSDAVAALIQGGCAVDLQDRVSGRTHMHSHSERLM